jgi:LysM repeat protein
MKISAKVRILGIALLICFVSGFFLVTSTLSADDFSEVQKMSEISGAKAVITYKLVTIEEGDSLWLLVSQSGIDMNTEALMEQTMAYNNLKGTYLTAGQKIYIPTID